MRVYHVSWRDLDDMPLELFEAATDEIDKMRGQR